MSYKRKITILGATGSVGQSTKEVLLKHTDLFEVHGVTAHNNVEELAKTAIELNAKVAIIANPEKLSQLKSLLSHTAIETLAGQGEIENIAQYNVDLVMAAIMGFAGLRPIVRALEKGTNIAIANKEPLVAAGAYIMSLSKKYGGKILPVDSEHNAIFQVLDEANKEQIDHIILTASGGPFLNWPKEEVSNATAAQAIKHPNWEMGKKISVDSASMMNKALEIIEAHYLFDLPPEKIKVLIHPQSTVHSMVSYVDGSILSQMGESDMRTPIAYALGYPKRIDSFGNKIDISKLSKLTFSEPDYNQFPALQYAYKALELGQNACIALNAANEVAVSMFLDDKIKFPDILEAVRYALDELYPKISGFELKTIEEIEKLDNITRKDISRFLETKTK